MLNVKQRNICSSDTEIEFLPSLSDLWYTHIAVLCFSVSSSDIKTTHCKCHKLHTLQLEG